MQSYATRPSEDAMPTTSCPYCNAAIPSPEPKTDRVTCPRCGEVVMRLVSANGMPSIPESGENATNVGPFGADRLSNRTVGRVVVTGMLLIAAATVVYALATTKQRRANDNPKEDKVWEPPVALRALPPAEWPGLGYVPDDSQAIAGIRLAAAIDSDAGQALLVSLGFPPDIHERRVLGVTPGDVDQLLFAANLKALPPRMTAVVRARRSIDAGRVRDALPGRRAIEHNGRSLSQGKLWAGGPEGVLWVPENTTLIATLLPEDVDKVPTQPQTTVDRLTSPLPALLRKRIDPDALVWLVGYAEPHNAALGLLSGLLPLPPTERDAWGRIESLAISVRANGTKLVLTAALRGQDSATSEALAGAVTRSLTTAGIAVEQTTDTDRRNLTATADAAVLAKWIGVLRNGPGK
jgi:hypothetical protein